jgi:putative transposase
MYRILDEHNEVRERRDQCRRPAAPKPALEATGPNQLWSWDISRLKGHNGVQYYLYVIIDVFSRYVPGWMIARPESAELADALLGETCAKQGIERDQLMPHADRGSAMRSKTVAQLLIDLGVAKSHSRPYTPMDNAYSEAQFKTLKYRPDYPSKFEGMTQARHWARAFFGWYNQAHHRTPPMQRILSGLWAAGQHRRSCPRRYGSINRRKSMMKPVIRLHHKPGPELSQSRTYTRQQANSAPGPSRPEIK